MKYAKPQMDVLEIEVIDIIQTSTAPANPGAGSGTGSEDDGRREDELPDF